MFSFATVNSFLVPLHIVLISELHQALRACSPVNIVYCRQCILIISHGDCMLADHKWSKIILAEFSRQVECQMHCLVLGNICSTQLTGKRNASMWMSKLQLTKVLSDYGKVVSVNFE